MTFQLHFMMNLAQQYVIFILGFSVIQSEKNLIAFCFRYVKTFLAEKV